MIDIKSARQITENFIYSACPEIEGADQSFVCIYGSSVYKPDSDSSDIDLLISAPPERIECIELGRVTGSVIELHEQLGRQTDEEVPYENKLLYSTEELIEAITFGGFVVEGCEIFVPEVKKSDEFLRSNEVKLRLALNALTTPNRIVSPCKEYADKLTRCAQISAVILGISTSPIQPVTSADILDNLTHSRNGKTGEDYLGYKIEFNPVREHITDFVKKGLDTMVADRFLTERDRRYNVEPGFHPISVVKTYLQTNELI